MKCYLLSLLALFSALPVFAQPASIVQDDGITSDFHRAHIGEIRFTATAIPAKAYPDAAYLTTYALGPKSDLFMTVFLGVSLTNVLHRLAPELPVEELVKTGNYQFTFYVDQRLVYTSNLHPGAPYPAIKNTETVLHKPLINNLTASGWWSQSLWNRFMNQGGEQALAPGKHLLRMEIRPYLEHPSLLVGPIIAAGQVALDVTLPVIDLQTIRLNPIVPGSGFATALEKFDADKIKALKGNIEAGVFKSITSVVVIKNGKLLVEEYFNGATRQTLHDPRSVGKSFASTLCGIAVEDGYLKGEAQPLSEFYDLRQFAHYTPEKGRITVRDLLTMRSAFAGNDEDSDSPGNEENMYPTEDWVKFTLSLPLDSAKPRGKWAYFTAGTVLLGDMLQQRVPGGLEAYADQKLFRPLGITTYKWQYTPQQVPNTAGSLQLSALDFAKYGQLYKNGGLWQGKQVLPAAWVASTLTRQVALPDRANEFYGYLFWNKTYEVQGTGYETFYCAGNGGNKIYVFKDQPLVVVVTATAYGAYYAHRQVDRMMSDFILPAVVDAGTHNSSRSTQPARPSARRPAQ